MTEWHVSLQESFVRNVRSITEFDHNYAVSILWRYGFFGGFFLQQPYSKLHHMLPAHPP